jgi:hypothetical protein
MGSYLAVGVTGAEAIMTTIHEGATPCITTWDVRNVTFHAIGLPLCRPVLIEEWDLGPFISAWVGRAGGTGSKCHARWAPVHKGG